MNAPVTTMAIGLPAAPDRRLTLQFDVFPLLRESPSYEDSFNGSEVSHESFAEFMRDRIFIPLGIGMNKITR
jgi:hypothetical protein